jgi:hypothetical protein
MHPEITVIDDPVVLLADTALAERVNLLGERSAVVRSSPLMPSMTRSVV